MVRKKAVKKTTPPATSQSKWFSPREISKPRIAIVLGVILLFSLAFLFRNLFIVATVNGQPITRLEYTKEMEKQSGKQTLQALVTKALIQQEAKKQNLTVTKAEIDTEINVLATNIANQGGNLEELMKTQGVQKADLEEQVRMQKLIEKLLAKDIVVSDKEAEDYVKANKESLFKDVDDKQATVTAKQQLRQTKMQSTFQAWLEELQKNAKITYLVAH